MSINTFYAVACTSMIKNAFGTQSLTFVASKLFINILVIKNSSINKTKILIKVSKRKLKSSFNLIRSCALTLEKITNKNVVIVVQSNIKI